MKTQFNQISGLAACPRVALVLIYTRVKQLMLKSKRKMVAKAPEEVINYEPLTLFAA